MGEAAGERKGKGKEKCIAAAFILIKRAEQPFN
jgi:hypothetical protein